MAENSDEKSDQVSEQKFQADEVCSLGLFGFSVSNLKDIVEGAVGFEGIVHLTIINKTPSNIDIQILGGSNKDVRQTLESGMTKIFSKKPKAGRIVKATNYELEVWAENKHTKVFVYGEGAPRANNVCEIRDEGIYLLDRHLELCVGKWGEVPANEQAGKQGVDQVDAQGDEQCKGEPKFSNVLKSLF